MIVAYPTGYEVADFLGQPDNTALAELAGAHVEVITTLAEAYCRGNGFTEAGLELDISHVVLLATARLVGNPEQIAYQVGNVTMTGAFKGWTLAERIILDKHRRTSA